MDAGVVQHALAVPDSEETGTLLKGGFTDAPHLLQVDLAAERPVLLAMLHDPRGQRISHTGNMCEQRPGRGVHVHAHAVHQVLRDLVELPREETLVHVVLVLADAQGPGIYLHESRHRVLQPVGNGDGPPDGDVQGRVLRPRDFARRIDGRAGLGDDGEPDRIAAARRRLRVEPGKELLGLPAPRPVANGDAGDSMLTN